MCVVNLPNLTANSDCAHNTMQLSMCVAWCSFLYSLMLLSFIHTWWLIASRFWCGQQCFPKVCILHWRILISAAHKILGLQRQKCSARHSITVVADLILIQGCISCGTCSYPELTEDHVLTRAYVKIFRTDTRNAVNKGVWRKKRLFLTSLKQICN